DNRATTGVAAVVATIAAAAAEKRGTFKVAGRNAQIAEHLRRITHRFLARGADLAHETLRAGDNHRRRNQKRRDAHIVEARDSAGRDITVHRAKHLDTGERVLYGDFRSLGIANFTDHDNVRVLAQNRSERVAEGQANVFFSRNLIDALQLEFHRVFDGHDVVFGIVQ